MKRKVGVVLSGCGFLDGSEIHEAVLTMLHLDAADVEVVCLAPRGAQRDVVDHEHKQPAAGEQRDVLREAARIARGRIRELDPVVATELDAVVFPGGYGAAKNLCDFAARGAAAVARPEVADLLRRMHAAKKPIGAVCIAPALIACVLGKSARPVLTIGDDAGTAKLLAAMGATHQSAAVTECVVDRANRIVSTPAYMYDARLRDVSAGIQKLVAALVGMMAEREAGARA
ncbi:MAG: isoprenoid biosynthesis glyoxalase ElbB [Planctomycetes bacterium]|nr:isoprenoid biosynthesis glyoxalase ElbB [Planctomycetota bacterium]